MRAANWPLPPLVPDRVASLLRFPARLASGVIWVYQRTLSPMLVAISPNSGCRFSPTCSCYAREALAEHGFVSGLWLTARRLVKCGPWHPGGEDPRDVAVADPR